MVHKSNHRHKVTLPELWVRLTAIVSLATGLAAGGASQKLVEADEPLTVQPATTPAETEEPYPPPSVALSSYKLGPGDEVRIWVIESDEMPDEPVRIGNSGYVSVPMAGRFRAAGLTVEQFEAEIVRRLKRFIREPAVSVSVTQFRSRPVSVIGAVKQPGIHHLQSPRTLLEVLSLAGGPRPDAGNRLKITRRSEYGPINLPGVAVDETGKFSLAEVDLSRLMNAERPAHNILVQPHDVISLPRADMVYVIGEVTRAGGFVLQERETVTVLQALALAGGLGRNPAPKRARILRPVNGTPEKLEIPINLKSIMAGKASDVALRQDDILFVPKSGGRAALKVATQAALTAATGITIWRVGTR